MFLERWSFASPLLGQKYTMAGPLLQKMGIWFHLHYRDTALRGDDTKPKFYSIEIGDKVTKVWILKYNKDKIVDEIRIKFRHDDRRQVEDAQKVALSADDYHIGLYSTDIILNVRNRKYRILTFTNSST
ncbi:MAG: hypothetical protein WKF87_19485 [Chryseolinea sp.]